MSNEQRAIGLADKKVFGEVGIELKNVLKVQAFEIEKDLWEVIYDLKTVDPYSRIKTKVNLSNEEVNIEKVET